MISKAIVKISEKLPWGFFVILKESVVVYTNMAIEYSGIRDSFQLSTKKYKGWQIPSNA